MGVGWRGRGVSRCSAYWDRQEVGRYSEDRRQMYPGSSAEGPVLTPQLKPQVRPKIDQSMDVFKVKKRYTRVILGLTKTRIPSASAFQLLAIFLSSSSAILLYILKRGSELSAMPGSPCDVWFCADGRILGPPKLWVRLVTLRPTEVQYLGHFQPLPLVRFPYLLCGEIGET
jgi:hypothetical protein